MCHIIMNHIILTVHVNHWETTGDIYMHCINKISESIKTFNKIYYSNYNFNSIFLTMGGRTHLWRSQTCLLDGLILMLSRTLNLKHQKGRTRK